MRFFFAALTLYASFLLPATAALDPVHTAGGLVSGVPGDEETIRVYRGIPYAAAPVGDLRWRPPQAPPSWKGVKTASRFSPACEQPPYPKGSLYYHAPEPESEDCLYLNIWTGARSPNERRPVMVWIHGGALTRGSGSIEVYDGEALARKGVVLVTINYRLGIFGFFAHPSLTAESSHRSSGNYGLLDQVAALQWVRQNIAGFGGDPQRVTIFGESAGSWSVNYLAATPLAHGLFQRAIGESGGGFSPQAKLADAEAAGLKFARSASLADLRAKPAAELLQASGLYSFPPSVDGWFLPEDVYSIYASGRQNDVPLLIGSNADEAKSLVPWSGTAAAFVAEQKRRFGDLISDFLRVYPASTDAEAESAHYASFRDYVFGWEMRTWARMATKTGRSPANLYYFSRVPPGPLGEKYGAYHAAEIVYVFDNLSRLQHEPWREEDRKLAGVLSSYWVNFARTGNPNGAGLPVWPSYQAKTDEVLQIGDTLAPVKTPHQAALDFLDRYFARTRAGK